MSVEIQEDGQSENEREKAQQEQEPQAVERDCGGGACLFRNRRVQDGGDSPDDNAKNPQDSQGRAQDQQAFSVA